MVYIEVPFKPIEQKKNGKIRQSVKNWNEIKSCFFASFGLKNWMQSNKCINTSAVGCNVVFQRVPKMCPIKKTHWL